MAPTHRQRPAAPGTLSPGDVVTYLPNGWDYTVCSTNPDGTFLLEAMGDAPTIWPWVTADKLHRRNF